MTAEDMNLVLTVGLLTIAVGLVLALLWALRVTDRADRRTALAVREADAAHSMLQHWTARAKRAERSVWGVDPQPGPPPHSIEWNNADETVQMAAVRDGT